MPDAVFMDSNDPDSGVYRALIEKTRRSDSPSESGPIISESESPENDLEELTIADSIPPEAGEAAQIHESLRPARIPHFDTITEQQTDPPPSSENFMDSLDEDELSAIESLGPFELLEQNHDSPDSQRIILDNNLANPLDDELDDRTRLALEEFQRGEILAELKKIYRIELQQGAYLPIEVLRNINTLLIDLIWIADEEQLRETIMIIMIAIDPNFGFKARQAGKNMDELRELFLERMEIRNFHLQVKKLRDSLPKPGSLPPPPLPK
ncbi:MAG: hypothetical protein ACOYUZ_01115 [Patescibacteria group bacterium]